MKFKTIIIYLILLIFTGCDQYNVNSSKKINTKIEKKYKNSGFTLVYNDNFDFKKLDSRSLQIFHKSLKKRSLVKITNPVNKKSLIAEVSSNNVQFSSFYNSVVSSRVAETLELDLKEPFVEIILISKNSTFIAKKAKTFDEEKEVAEKAPIDGIKISNLSNSINDNKKQSLHKEFSYSIKIADFYYKKTARLMIDRIRDETTLTNFKIVQLSKTNYRLIIGPFNDIKSLKDSFEKIDALYFENLEILKDV